MNGSRYCARCGAEILTANLMLVDPGIDFNHFTIILPGGRPRQLAPSEWRLFVALYQRHGRVVGAAELAAASGVAQTNLRVQIRRLRVGLTRSRFSVISHRTHGWELVVRPDR